MSDDLRALVAQAVASLPGGGASTVGRSLNEQGATSDLSIDEVLLLHAVGWEPVDLVCGASVASVYAYTWNWGVGEITDASDAHTRAVATAVERISDECRRVGGHGVVGVTVSFEIYPHHIDAILVGTAVRPIEKTREIVRYFVSDLSTRDFCLLHQAGWKPMGLAFGASFVHAPRRSAATALQQRTQNVELTNFTEALYAARESAMERMQSSALRVGATGVVAAQIHEGPMYFANHAIGFTAWGTGISPAPSGHRFVQPQVVLTMDDAELAFDAQSLAGGH
jgi:uncharacterized protein YbjQ (UPF0145 family)